jgi:hypothetical protein
MLWPVTVRTGLVVYRSVVRDPRLNDRIDEQRIR